MLFGCGDCTSKHKPFRMHCLLVYCFLKVPPKTHMVGFCCFVRDPSPPYKKEKSVLAVNKLLLRVIVAPWVRGKNVAA